MDHHAGALACERARDAETDAFRRPGHERVFAGESHGAGLYAALQLGRRADSRPSTRTCVARARQDSTRGVPAAGAEAAARPREAAECSAAPSRRAPVAQSRAAVWYSPAGAEAAACRTRDW